MLVTKDQLDRVINEVNTSYARHERMIDELRKRIEELESQERKKPGRPPKEAA